MSETRKKISIPSNDYKLAYGLSYGSIGVPYYETLANIRLLLTDGVKVNEHLGDTVVALTLENYDKDNSTSTPEEIPVEVASVSLSLTNVTIQEGETTTASVQVLPQEAKDKTVTYTSEDESIATVVQTGVVTAVKAGSTNIVATSKNGKVGKAKLTVEALPVEVASVNLSLLADSITVGDSTTVSADVQPTEAINQEVTYTSENEGVVTVQQDGTITSVAEGTTNIVGRTSNGTEGRVSITVTPAVPV